jgi:Tol biopolymer transport system component
MSPTTKRILLIALLLGVAALIGWGLYMLFVKPSPFAPTRQSGTTGGQPTGALPGSGTRTSSPGGAGGTTQPGSLPTANITTPPTNQNYYRPQLVTQLTTDFTLFPSVETGGNLRYHNAADGKFYSIGTDGKIIQLSDQVFYNVQDVTWAKTANKAVIAYPDSTKIIYNFETKTQVTLPKHWQDFSFSPDSSQIAAKSMALAPENRWLVTTKDDGTGAKLIEPLGNNADKVIMNWSPSGQAVAFSSTGEPQGADRQEQLIVGLNGENFKSIVVEGLDFQPQWSPTGKQLIYSVDSQRSDYKPELWIVDSYGESIGNNRKMLSVNTWANKCTFGNDTTLYCAVPRELPQGAGMSPAIAADTPDDLYRIDVKTGTKTQIPLDKDYTIDSISIDTTNNKIIFSDHHLTGAYGVNL